MVKAQAILFGHVMENLGSHLTLAPEDEGGIRDYCEGAQCERVTAVYNFIKTEPKNIANRLPRGCTLYDLADAISEVLFEKGLQGGDADLWNAVVVRVHGYQVDSEGSK